MSDFKVEPDLPIDANGVIYHLACKRADLSDRILLVGDPGRVPVVAAHFDANSITFDGTHREIRIMTGAFHGRRVTVLSTGMGTDNVEIVINEIHALFELNTATMKWADQPADVVMIRVGTCGSPLAGVIPGTLAITKHALGMDNTCRYYVDHSGLGKSLRDEAMKTPLGGIGVYGSQAHPAVTAAIDAAAARVAPSRPRVIGATASGSGFYGCQGRVVGRFANHVAIPNLVDVLGSIRFDDGEGAAHGRVVNIEMENSAICCLSSILGYRAGTVCVIVAARTGETRSFIDPSEAKVAIEQAIDVGLEALVSL